MPVLIRKEDISLGRALGCEWIDTNGRGGYASSSILNCHTRKYHGLLVAQLAEPPGRFVLLSKTDESLIVGDREELLGLNQYPEVMFPRGHKYQTQFALELGPTFVYTVGGTTLRKELFLVDGENTLLIKYTCLANEAGAKLRVRPLLAFRDFHGLVRENMFLRVRTFPCREGFLIHPYEGLPPLYMQVEGRFGFWASPDWYRNVEYYREKERGFPFREDLFSPGFFEIEMPEGAEIILSASTRELPDTLGQLWRKERARRETLATRIVGETPLERRLSHTAASFFQRDHLGRMAITAGWPWFLAWGRDALISLPGLAIENGRLPEALEILETFAAEERDGLVPNFLGLTGADHAYNSADASLWLAVAARAWVQAGGDPQALGRVVYPTLARIFETWRIGTIHDIRVLDNGLVTAGNDQVQITWMDAKVHGLPATPRAGCAVEINALWHTFLRFTGELAERFGHTNRAAGCRALAAKVEANFLDTFWLEEEGYLADVVRGDRVDRSLRPNQILAVSLGGGLVPEDKARSLLGHVRKELLTPFGLRTLSPRSSAYRGRYQGPPEERDLAYHNGTVWPWLLGHYGQALLAVSDHPARDVADLAAILERFERHLEDAGLGSVSEVYDGDPPHDPGGCPSQAWSVAEIYRLSRMVREAGQRLIDKTGGKS